MYKLQKSLLNGEINMVIRLSDMVTVPFSPGNIDYQEYLAWLAAGNEPEPADTEN